MSDPMKIAALLEIAQRALDVEDRVVERTEHMETLRSAYKFHKRTLGMNDHDFIKREGSEWDAVKAATAVEYADAEKAKRAEYNARRRLQTAIRNYRAKAYA
jgi:hypothetical protein